MQTYFPEVHISLIILQPVFVNIYNAAAKTAAPPNSIAPTAPVGKAAPPVLELVLVIVSPAAFVVVMVVAATAAAPVLVAVCVRATLLMLAKREEAADSRDLI